MRPARFENHIEVKDKAPAVELLAQATGLSRQKLKSIMQKGAVWLTHNGHTQRIRRVKKMLQHGDQLHLYYDESVLSEEPAKAVLIEDEQDYSIWYKPCGMLSQGSKWGDHTTLYRYVEKNLQPERPAFIVHRLDRAASGLMIIAHSKKIAAAFSEMFKQRKIEKKYRVIVHGHVDNSLQTICEEIDGKSAVSHVSLLESDDNKDRSLLEINIETGRKHQIRRHLSQAGYPVVGDRLYGSKTDSENLQLTACYIEFTAPVTGDKKAYTLKPDLLPALY